jgi:hypothetical protein
MVVRSSLSLPNERCSRRAVQHRVQINRSATALKEIGVPPRSSKPEMFVVFAPRKSETRESSALVATANDARVNWYARCFWCSAAGQRRGVRTRESVRVSGEQRERRGERARIARRGGCCVARANAVPGSSSGHAHALTRALPHRVLLGSNAHCATTAGLCGADVPGDVRARDEYLLLRRHCCVSAGARPRQLPAGPGCRYFSATPAWKRTAFADSCAPAGRFPVIRWPPKVP